MAMDGGGGFDASGYDVMVIGSGYGGSVAACRLAVAGVEVCLVEKGRRWESHDFPTTCLGMVSATRIENNNWGFALGSNKALFQVHEDGDSLCCVPCGLGGGSLVNAGALISTPTRTKKDPKWPKEWVRNWEANQAMASVMLGADVAPVDFFSAKVMREIAREEIEECREDEVKLSISFNNEGKLKSSESQRNDTCLACGNCLSGCPYNAKNSTDKNYLALAVQAGCIVKTEHEALYLVKNQDREFDREPINGRRKRRWRVHFNDFECAYADFVILSAGVFGTTKIMFQSQRRGLILSSKLGHGFSCNGNNVAYVAGSQAPMNGHGLSKPQFAKVPFGARPGPAISSSFTSSAGFTIQPAVLPTSYPYLVFKGIATYGWPNGFWLFHGLVDTLKRLLGYRDTQAIVLNVMGYDSCDGRIILDKGKKNISFTSSNDPLLIRKIQALQRITKRLGGIMFMSRYRSTSVHLLGGCNASDDSLNGVCNPSGQVFDPSSNKVYAVHEGLYVCDASLVPCSVGLNPVLTITTAAEHVSKFLIADVMKYKAKFHASNTTDAAESVASIEEKEKAVIDKVMHSNSSPVSQGILKRNEASAIIDRKEGVTIRETMRGYIGGAPCTAYLVMKMNLSDMEEPRKIKTSIGEEVHPLLRGEVGGYVLFQAISKEPLYIIDGNVDMCKVSSRNPYTQYMHYKLVLASSSGSRYLLEGKKVMNPFFLGLKCWRESRTLHVSLTSLVKYETNETTASQRKVAIIGELCLSEVDLFKSLISIKGKYRFRFIFLLLRSFWRTYFLQIPRRNANQKTNERSNTIRESYPPNTLYTLETGDGYTISCRQWRRDRDASNREKFYYPVLLLNGHSTESYCLPTEPKDLVRTLLKEGHEVWVLQSRIHPLHCSNNVTIEDIARFDIPTVIAKMLQEQEPGTKIHVIGHCVGGLAIHMALLGGYVHASHIASIACTNSSMFFKLNSWAKLKMRFPLVPVSMAILGKDTVISMFGRSDESLRHRLVKSIVRFIPRYENCTLDECNLFSGVFGNPFWHENVTESMHQWLNKEALPRLPLSTFPQIRKICNSGFIVDSNGKNVFLIHPERMAVPTLYVSGGKTVLVTPETSLLAHRYMKLHQPRFEHKRVIVDGFGHSDLLIGEDAYTKVFPHFMSHIRSAEQEQDVKAENRRDSSQLWEGVHDGNKSFGAPNYFMYLVTFLAFVFLYLLLFG